MAWKNLSLTKFMQCLNTA